MLMRMISVKIDREDVNRMRNVARQVSKERSAFKRRCIERDFVESMAEKYGRSKAMEMLTKVWKLSTMMSIFSDCEFVDGTDDGIA